MTAPVPAVPGESEERHYFVFSTNWSGGQRLCGECRQTAEGGDHPDPWVDLGIKERTNYVCPVGRGGLGHSATYTGSPPLSLRGPRDGFCVCGEPFVEEDAETWQLSWEHIVPGDDRWHPVSVIRSRHAAESQRDGLLALIDQGEPIRAVSLQRLAAVSL